MAEQIVSLFSEDARKRWNAFVADSRWGHALQSWEWGEFKKSLGWQAERIGIQSDGQIVAGAQLLLKRLPLLPLTIAYVPKGPVVDLADDRLTGRLFAVIHQVARSHRAIFTKIEPNLLDDDHTHTLLKQYGFEPTFHTNQPRSTIVIDLTEGSDVLLNKMRKNTRKLIRRAARKGVKIDEGGASDLDALCEMMAAAAKRKGHSVHEKRFYQQEWQAFQTTGSIKVLVARYQSEVVAVKMILIFGGKSMHLSGGVSYKGREVYANYLLQWRAIQWAIEHGCKLCDLWGIPDEVGDMLKKGQEIPKDRYDGLWGTYMFKRGFGGQVEYYVGAYDYAYRPQLYWLGMNLLVRNRSVSQVSGWLERVFGGP
jgi:peptidoglycan pentaglycine glycine transferase (the first glycine)